MAEPVQTVTGNFPRKIFAYVAQNYDSEIATATSQFETQLAAGSLNTSGIFIPKFSAITGPTVNKLEIASTIAGASTHVYKINVPGFFYYQHWKGPWSSDGFLQILVRTDASLEAGAYEYINTRGRKASGTDTYCDHSNMIPIRPGANTHVMCVGSLSSSEGKSLYFIPAWGYDGVAAITDEGVHTVPTTVVSGTAMDAGFKACFAV